MLSKAQRFVIEQLKSAETITLYLGGGIPSPTGERVDYLTVNKEQKKLKHDIALAFQDAFNRLNNGKTKERNTNWL